MRLRQCVFVAKDLESAADELCDILGIEVAFRDPGVAKWGLVNVVCATGHDFLEIITPFQDGTSAGRYIERRKGDGGYMVIFQIPDAAAERKRLTAMGVRTIAQKDLPEHVYTQIHPPTRPACCCRSTRPSRPKASIRRCGGRRPKRTGSNTRVPTQVDVGGCRINRI